jgi:hypothetical protein
MALRAHALVPRVPETDKFVGVTTQSFGTYRI